MWFAMMISSLLWAFSPAVDQVLVNAPPLLVHNQVITTTQFGSTQGTDLAPAAPQQVQFQVEPVTPVAVGKAITLKAKLLTRDGQPVVDAVVVLSLEAEQLQRRRTDTQGQIIFSLVQKWPPATYKLELLVAGTAAYEGAIAVAEVVVEPIQSTIQVIPPLAGVRFAITGQEVTTDQAGHAVVEVEQAGNYELDLLTLHEEHPKYRFEFDRWQVEVFDTRREVALPEEERIQAGFNVSYQVTTSFVDTAGQPVDPQRITELTFQSSNGGTLTLKPAEPYWLQANRIMRRSTGLEAVPIQYSLQSVMIDGATVVNRGQQKFFADTKGGIWQIKLIFFSARFAAKDALFGWPIGSGIKLTYPNDEVVFHPFDQNHEVNLSALARGDYQVQVANPSGIAPLTPVAISRKQDVELLVISYIDLGVFAACGAAVALALLLIGRPTLVGNLFSRRRPTLAPAYFSLQPVPNQQDGLRINEQGAQAYLFDNHSYKGWFITSEHLQQLNRAKEQPSQQGVRHELTEAAKATVLE